MTIAYVISIPFLSIKIDNYYLSRNLKAEKYKEICAVLSYKIYIQNDSKTYVAKIDDRIIEASNWGKNFDYGVWTVIGILENQKNDIYNIDHESVMKYFDHHKDHCRKIEK